MESSPLRWCSSGRLGQAPNACVYLIGGEAIKGLVRTLAVVELEPQSDTTPGLGHGLVRFQVRLLVCETPPKPLDKNVIEPSTPAVHADLNAGLLEQAGEKLARKLKPPGPC